MTCCTVCTNGCEASYLSDRLCPGPHSTSLPAIHLVPRRWATWFSFVSLLVALAVAHSLSLVCAAQAAKLEKLAAFEARQAEAAKKQQEKEEALQEELARQEKDRQQREAKRVAALQEAIR